MGFFCPAAVAAGAVSVVVDSAAEESCCWSCWSAAAVAVAVTGDSLPAGDVLLLELVVGVVVSGSLVSLPAAGTVSTVVVSAILFAQVRMVRVCKVSAGKQIVAICCYYWYQSTVDAVLRAP